jgi:hypothetical protein
MMSNRNDDDFDIRFDDDTNFDEVDFEEQAGKGALPAGIVIEDEPVAQSDGKFLGMTAGERAFLSVMLFLNVLVLGAGLLIATGRIVI